MAKAKANSSSEPKKRRRTALTPEARENQLIALAVDLAEKQLLEGTASSQVITHYLKLGSTKGQIELERLRQENELIKAKTEAINSQKNLDAMYVEAVEAMKRYSGTVFNDEVDDGQNIQ